MALSDTKVYYLTIRDDLLTTLRNNVATLNTNLTKTITDTTTQIVKGNPLLMPSMNFTTRYPMIGVAFNRELETYKTLGQRKDGTLIFDIYAIARIVGTTGYDDDDEKMYLIDNIKSVLRQNITFSTKIRYLSIPETIFEIPSGNEIYVSGGIISLELLWEVI